MVKCHLPLTASRLLVGTPNSWEAQPPTALSKLDVSMTDGASAAASAKPLRVDSYSSVLDFCRPPGELPRHWVFPQGGEMQSAADDIRPYMKALVLLELEKLRDQ